MHFNSLVFEIFANIDWKYLIFQCKMAWKNVFVFQIKMFGYIFAKRAVIW